MRLFIDKNATRTFQSKLAPQIVWTLKAIDGLTMLHVQDTIKAAIARTKDGETVDASLIYLLHCQHGIAGATEDGNPVEVPFVEEVVPYLGTRRFIPKEFFGSIHARLLVEVGTEIIRDNTLTEDEAKNS